MNADQLRDEITLREASLADARREHAAGELSDDAFAALERRERERLDVVRARLEALASAPAPSAVATRRRRRRRWLVVALGCFALAAVVLLWSSLSPRQSGNSITGSISLSHAQQINRLLTQAEADVANGDVVAALSAYEGVLAIDATNAVALTEVGWLDFSAGSSDDKPALAELGISDLQKAIIAAPRDAAPRLYYAIAAASTKGYAALAKQQFTEFLALHPSKGQLAIAAPFLKQFGLSS